VPCFDLSSFCDRMGNALTSGRVVGLLEMSVLKSLQFRSVDNGSLVLNVVYLEGT